MVKQIIEFTDYNGIKRTEEWHFHLNKAEMIEMEVSFDGGFSEAIKKMQKTENALEILKTFKEVVRKAVGRKSEDGMTFIKNDEIVNRFFQSEAFSEFLMDMLKHPDKCAAFMKSLAPKDE